MKNLYKIIIILALFMLIPVGVDAAHQSSGQQSNNAGIVNTCSPNCVGIQRSSSLGGVRITFVDANGSAVDAANRLSFDFVTYVDSSKGNFTTFINGYAGDRNKLAQASGGNFADGSVKQQDIPRFSAVAAAYNRNAPLEGSTNQTSLRTSGNTGGNLNAGYNSELQFFLSLTKSTNPFYAADVNAFIKAIAEVSGGFNASDLIYTVAEGCSTGDEIFIIMEPLFFWSGQVNGSYQNYFGTLSDSYYFFGGSLLNNAASHFTNMAYVIYYQEEIAAFKGASGIAKRAFPIQSGADLLSTVGYGLAVDWANDPGGYCGSCQFDPSTGVFTNNDTQYTSSTVPGRFNGSIPEFAYTDIDKGGAGCCSSLAYMKDQSPAWANAFNALCSVPEPECCTPSVPNTPEISVNNCCNDSATSYVKESELDEIFCYDSELRVDHFKDRCENERFKKTAINEYCELYCTERVELEVPGSITAASGSYFTLSKTSRGTSSPYLDGYLRCRIKIYYNEWRNDYIKEVENEIKKYNEFQEYAAKEKMYMNALTPIETIHVKGTMTATCTKEITITQTTVAGQRTTARPTTYTDTVTGTADLEYTYYKHKYSPVNYYTVKLNDSNSYSGIGITSDGKTNTVTHDTYSISNYTNAKSDYDKAVSAARENAKTKGADDSYNCTYTAFQAKDDSINEENPNTTLSSIRSSMASIQTAFEAAVNGAANKEAQIDQCDFYFNDSQTHLSKEVSYDGKDAKKQYSFEPDVSFRYSQVYLNENAKAAMDTLSVDFERTCNYDIIYPSAGDTEISGDTYSGKYGNGEEIMRDFASTKLSYASYGGYQNFLDSTPYKAKKIFTTDAKYHAACFWTEKTTPIYTLAPTGEIATEASVKNYTIHDYEFTIYTTTMDGTYETYWDIDNIGQNGDLTEYFKQGTLTCGYEDPEKAQTTIACTLHVEHEFIETGKCNGSNGSDVTLYAADCDPYKEYELFSFKVVDPSDFFPTGTDENGSQFAYNWTSTEKGQAVMKEINDRAAIGGTYAPENISYMFELDSSSMKHIKNYNASRTSENGYSDFNMHCSCPTFTQSNSYEEGIACTQCKSYFIENLENGIVAYSGTNHKVNVWASSSRLQEIRDKLTAKGRW